MGNSDHGITYTYTLPKSQTLNPNSGAGDVRVARALTAESNRLFQVLDLHWRSLESGGVWCKSRRLKKTIFISHNVFVK